MGLTPLAAGSAEYHAGLLFMQILTFERSALGAAHGNEKLRFVAVRLSPYRSIDRVDRCPMMYAMSLGFMPEALRLEPIWCRKLLSVGCTLRLGQSCLHCSRRVSLIAPALRCECRYRSTALAASSKSVWFGNVISRSAPRMPWSSFFAPIIWNPSRMT